MKIKHVLLTAAVTLFSLTAWSQNLATGEYGYLMDGSHAKMGQPTADHLFVRGTFDGETVDNKVTFDEGDTKLI